MRIALDQIHLLLGDRGAVGCDDLCEAEGVCGNHVHVALDDHGAVGATDGVIRAVEAVEVAALVEQRGLRCVEVLRRVLRVEGTRAEADETLPDVPGGEDEPVAEAVVDTAVLGAHGEARLDDIVLGEAACNQVVGQGAPIVRGIAQLPRRDRLGVEAARVAVGACLLAGRTGEVRLEEDRSCLVGLQETLVLLALLHLALRGRGEFDAGAVRAEAESLLEVEALAAAHELDHVAARGAGAEAVPGLALRIHDKRRRALVVERAAGLVVAAGLLEVCDIAGHNINDVEAGLHVNYGGHLLG